MSILQIIIAKIDPKYENNASKVVKVLEFANGVRSIYYGSAMDHENTVVICSIWTDLSHSHAYIKSTEYPKFINALNELVISPPQITHSEIENQEKDLNTVLNSPCIEMAPLKLKRDRLASHYHNFIQGGKIIAAADGNVGQFQNMQIEDPFTQWSLVAWESMAKHEEFGKSEVFPSFLKLVEPNVDMPGPPAIIHVKLTQVSGNMS